MIKCSKKWTIYIPIYKIEKNVLTSKPILTGYFNDDINYELDRLLYPIQQCNFNINQKSHLSYNIIIQ